MNDSRSEISRSFTGISELAWVSMQSRWTWWARELFQCSQNACSWDRPLHLDKSIFIPNALVRKAKLLGWHFLMSSWTRVGRRRRRVYKLILQKAYKEIRVGTNVARQLGGNGLWVVWKTTFCTVNCMLDRCRSMVVLNKKALERLDTSFKI